MVRTPDPGKIMSVDIGDRMSVPKSFQIPPEPFQTQRGRAPVGQTKLLALITAQEELGEHDKLVILDDTCTRPESSI
jgi:hypothetical protein